MQHSPHRVLTARQEVTLARGLFRTLARTAIELGDIDPRTLPEHELPMAVMKWWKQNKKSLFLVIDYRDHLLREAGKYRAASPGIACLLYGTWVEHTVNTFVRLACARKRLPASLALETIKDLPLRAKVSWFLILSGHARIPKTHQMRISRLADARNAFAHYKWKGNRDWDADPASGFRAALVDVDKTIRFLKRYESTHFLLGSGRKIRGATRPRGRTS